MELGVSLTYSDFFEGAVPEVATLLADIPSSHTINLLSLINAHLYLNEDSQIEILDFLLQRQQPALKKHIARKIASIQNRRKTRISIFSTVYTLEFIHYELIHYRNIDAEESPDKELSFFKAYLILSQNIAEHLLNSVPQPGEDPFRKKLWSVLMEQFPIDHPINPVTEIPKSIALLNYFEFHSNHSEYVSNFLRAQNKQTSWNYILDVTGLITQGWQYRAGESMSHYPFVITVTDGFGFLLSGFTLDLKSYQLKYSQKKSSYTGLKEKPLFQISEDKVVVLSWNLLAAKIYEGLVFDFYQLSGIQSKFDKFISYKKYISEEVIERYLFRSVIKALFNRKEIVRFDEGNRQGFPDAYIRKGKYVFLFEIKDALFPSDVIDSQSYERIKNVIDEKYNSDQKGTGQFIKQLKFLKQGTFEDKTFDELRIKRRNIVVYPIIVYTDRHFGMPGFNRYLVDEFKNKLKQNDLVSVFGDIRPLSFVSLSSLMSNIDILQSPASSFKEVLDKYHASQENALKRFQKKINRLKSSLAINESLDSFFQRNFHSKIKASNRNYVDAIVKILGLTDFLPKDPNS